MIPPRTPSLGPRQIHEIHKAVDQVFDRLKVRFLGEHFMGKRLYVTYNRFYSLPGLFSQANREEGVEPDQKILNQLLSVAETYLDATRERMKARTVNTIQSFIADAHQAKEQVDIKTVLGGQLSEVHQEAANHVRMIAEAEANHTKNVGSLEGIVRINSAVGIDDPRVAFVVVNDKDLCDECRRLHLLTDGVTPRVWALSSVGHGYHKKGDPNPKMGGLHPNCRCSLITVMPGYGFNAAGLITYIGKDHDELEHQKGK